MNPTALLKWRAGRNGPRVVICSSFVHIWGLFYWTRQGKQTWEWRLEANGREQQELEPFVRTSGPRWWHLVPLTWALSKEDMHTQAGCKQLAFILWFDATVRLFDAIMSYLIILNECVGICAHIICHTSLYWSHSETHIQILCILCHKSLCWSDGEIFLGYSAQL